MHTLTTQHDKFRHLTARLKGAGLKGGGSRTCAGETDSDSNSASDSNHSHKRGRKTRVKKGEGKMTQALHAITSLAD